MRNRRSIHDSYGMTGLDCMYILTFKDKSVCTSGFCMKPNDSLGRLKGFFCQDFPEPTFSDQYQRAALVAATLVRHWCGESLDNLCWPIHKFFPGCYLECNWSRKGWAGLTPSYMVWLPGRGRAYMLSLLCWRAVNCKRNTKEGCEGVWSEQISIKVFPHVNRNDAKR